MDCIKFLLPFFLILYCQDVHGRVLREIIDVLIANPHTRFMVRQALLKYDRFLPLPKALPRLPPIISNEAPMMTLIPLSPLSPLSPISPISPLSSVLPNDTDESEDEVTISPQPIVLKDKNVQDAFPWRPIREPYPNVIRMKKIGRQPRLPWKNAPPPLLPLDQPERMEAMQPGKVNYLTPGAKLYAASDARPGGIALEVNGDMKAIIPPTIAEAWRKPIDDLTESPAVTSPFIQSPLRAYFLKLKDTDTADTSEDDTEKEGPLSDKMFRKKREIIRELKSLFKVLFEGEMSGTNIVKSTKRHRVRIARGRKKARITASNSYTKKSRNQKKSVVARVEDQFEEATKKSYRPSKRVMLYKRLIGDLNDLIALEIRKSNGKKNIQGKLEGVKSSVVQLSKADKDVEKEDEERK